MKYYNIRAGGCQYNFKQSSDCCKSALDTPAAVWYNIPVLIVRGLVKGK